MGRIECSDPPDESGGSETPTVQRKTNLVCCCLSGLDRFIHAPDSRSAIANAYSGSAEFAT